MPKRISTFSLFTFSFLLSQSLSAQETNFRMPAEWEKQEAVWVGWEMFGPFKQPVINTIKALVPFVQVKVLAESGFSSKAIQEYLALQGVDTSKIIFYAALDNRVWLRDHGATFLLNDKKELAVADFKWTLYGIKDWLKWNTRDSSKVESAYRSALKKTGQIDSLMAVAENAKNIQSKYVMEGGSIEVNGKGVLIMNETITLQRNPGVKLELLEAEFKRVLGAKKIIWVKHGLADDPHIIRPITENYIGFGTGGHTDEFVRFADEHTILLAWVDETEKDLHPINKMNYDRMKANLEILEKATDTNGKPFRIIKVPLPDPIHKKVRIVDFQKNEFDEGILSSWLSESSGFKTGDTVIRVAAASYLNYFISNGVVLLPTYANNVSSTTKEEQVKKIFASVFPGRKLIFIDVLSLNYEGGGIHCITQQQPAR